MSVAVRAYLKVVLTVAALVAMMAASKGPWTVDQMVEKTVETMAELTELRKAA